MPATLKLFHPDEPVISSLLRLMWRGAPAYVLDAGRPADVLTPSHGEVHVLGSLMRQLKAPRIRGSTYPLNSVDYIPHKLPLYCYNEQNKNTVELLTSISNSSFRASPSGVDKHQWPVSARSDV